MEFASTIAFFPDAAVVTHTPRFRLTNFTRVGADAAADTRAFLHALGSAEKPARLLVGELDPELVERVRELDVQGLALVDETGDPEAAALKMQMKNVIQ